MRTPASIGGVAAAGTSAIFVRSSMTPAPVHHRSNASRGGIPQVSLCTSVIFSENRCPLFEITLARLGAQLAHQRRDSQRGDTVAGLAQNLKTKSVEGETLSG